MYPTSCECSDPPNEECVTPGNLNQLIYRQVSQCMFNSRHMREGYGSRSVCVSICLLLGYSCYIPCL